MLRHLLPKAFNFIPVCSARCTSLNPVKSFQVDNTRQPDKKKLYLSDLTEYVNKQIFLLEPPEHQDGVLTTQTMLDACHSIEDVLVLIENMHQCNKLWNDELMLYYRQLSKLLGITSNQYTIQDAHNILNDKRFYLLLKKTMTVLAQMNSRNLVNFFYCLIKFKVPSTSFTVKHTVEMLKNKLNNFFPKDVIICFAALKTCDTNSPEMEALDTGLLMHLENLAIDEAFFVRSATDAYVEIPYGLCKAFGSKASPLLKKGLSECLHKSLQVQGNVGQSKDLIKAIKVLQSLTFLQYPHKSAINTAIKEIKFNADTLTSLQRWTVLQSLDGLNVSFSHDVKLLKLLNQDGIHKLNHGST